jgi:hypothetical protein
MKLTKIETQFQDVALVRGGVFLLRQADALRFVETCRSVGIRISGLEGFRVDGDGQSCGEYGLLGVSKGPGGVVRGCDR